jgi:hypothetical protein
MRWLRAAMPRKRRDEIAEPGSTAGSCRARAVPRHKVAAGRLHLIDMGEYVIKGCTEMWIGNVLADTKWKTKP